MLLNAYNHISIEFVLSIIAFPGYLHFFRRCVLILARAGSYFFIYFLFLFRTLVLFFSLCVLCWLSFQFVCFIFTSVFLLSIVLFRFLPLFYIQCIWVAGEVNRNPRLDIYLVISFTRASNHPRRPRDGLPQDN